MVCFIQYNALNTCLVNTKDTLTVYSYLFITCLLNSLFHTKAVRVCEGKQLPFKVTFSHSHILKANWVEEASDNL